MMRARERWLFALFWLLPAALGTLAFHWVPSRYNPELGYGGIFLSQLLIWGAWAGWSALIIGAAERVPLERGSIARALAVHAVLCAAVVVGEMLVIDQVQRAFRLVPLDPLSLESTLAFGMRRYGDMLVVVYWAVVGAHTALRWHGRWRDEAVRVARLNADLAAARLEALRAQLNPHFLFNALNSIVALVDADPKAAQRTTIQLADLLRATLAAGDQQETTLAAEVELTRRYLAIEEVRFADRLTVRWAVAPGLDGRRVPAFTLQPLVENALRHGIAKWPGAGMIEVAAEARDAALVLRVSDDGPGVVPGAESNGAGIALRNLRARLERLYGAGAGVTLSAREGGGTVAEVVLPGASTEVAIDRSLK